MYVATKQLVSDQLATKSELVIENVGVSLTFTVVLILPLDFCNKSSQDNVLFFESFFFVLCWKGNFFVFFSQTFIWFILIQ